MKNNNYALIMAGGIGSRFWPVSRTSYPKQFLDVLGTGKSLIQNTFERFKKILPVENIFILTNESYFDLVKQQIPELSDNQIIAFIIAVFICFIFLKIVYLIKLKINQI